MTKLLSNKALSASKGRFDRAIAAQHKLVSHFFDDWNFFSIIARKTTNSRTLRISFQKRRENSNRQSLLTL
ncbi:MAG: hypothetical protein EOS36_27425 [Mesorhizobium sp.]|uniref:hypothetical protein n=1 Tax=Mesorhizobium sp. TaxID=1871066 RepID=UPI000FE49B53|nr:hypothetical protein [Mesorhizobium sp.]RWD56997.1 MAG: hypothetical protein EOS36_27425 [Mesorhizobium sp.]RWE31893.1 MAG: hypothetical protein EOS79_31425 [Mesorhizobium sp.]